ncbi:MAG: crossover junction endodeoxyribonuclease RuvC [Clostridia bacterium]|nr:crossover junction endodeoxyribonuclease RuvC [Clostridia bacterium]
MKILGIDPGYAIIGYGVVDYAASSFRTLDYGAITTPAKIPVEDRLEMIYGSMCELIDKYKPDDMAVEQLFFNTNQTTAIKVAEARGVILLAARQKGVHIFEYTPLQVKQAVVGYGKADKKQVQIMVTTLLQLKQIPKPDDTADALAIAVCHAHSGGSGLSRLLREQNGI